MGNKKMIQSAEKRVEIREFHIAPVLVQELNDIFIYSARIFNYSGKGVYIETDTALKVGTDIIIGLEDSAFISPDSPKFYHAKILWQKNFIIGVFKYGYGAKFVYFNDRQTVPDSNSVTLR